ncbi:hypothetical protein GDO86_014118 [Hymenochirus boettgeri]|uniref:Acyl-CoA thioesterase-like N-terminal HotDog domain-containing protein n=1 Tax=Hymenochirus boettgeri TaxID=247094 RepID=A0A8T2JT05_9PIPI|nr:hypothetical protein GDO86_014118 [Hymenochirus boettgeri]
MVNMAASSQSDCVNGPAEAKPSDLRSVLVTSVLNLEPLDKDLFRGSHYWVPKTQRLFGGQIVGQALVAAASSVSEDVYVHSLHCYFVRAGDPKVPALYQVERIRDGRSFCVRSVKAIQHGVPILICQASFQQLQESPLQHQFTMPTVPPPEDLLSREELINKYLRPREYAFALLRSCLYFRLCLYRHCLASPFAVPLKICCFSGPFNVVPLLLQG